MYEYFVEIPNFKYDREALLKYQKEITDWRPNVHYTKAGIDTGKRNSWFDYYPDKNTNIIKLSYTNNRFIRTISNQLCQKLLLLSY